MLFLLIFKKPIVYSSDVIFNTEKYYEDIVVPAHSSITQLFVENNQVIEKNDIIALLDTNIDLSVFFDFSRFIDNYYTKVLELDKGGNEKRLDNDIIGLKKYLAISELTKLHMELHDLITRIIKFKNDVRNFQYEKRRETFLRKIDNVQNIIKELDLKNDLLQYQLEIEQKSYDNYKILNVSDYVSEDELEKKKLELNKTLSLISSNKSEQLYSINTLTDIQTSLIDLESQNQNMIYSFHESIIEKTKVLIKKLDDWKAHHILKASINGVVNFVNFKGLNQIVRTAEIVFAIVPVENHNITGIFYVPADYPHSIEPGMEFIIKLRRYPFRKYGYINATVSSVSLIHKDGKYIVYFILSNGFITNKGIKIPYEKEIVGYSEIVIDTKNIFFTIFDSFNG